MIERDHLAEYQVAQARAMQAIQSGDSNAAIIASKQMSIINRLELLRKELQIELGVSDIELDFGEEELESLKNLINQESNFQYFGKLISLLRKERRLSQKKFGQQSGMSQAWISLLENGQRANLSTNNLRGLVIGLGLGEEGSGYQILRQRLEVIIQENK